MAAGVFSSSSLTSCHGAFPNGFSKLLRPVAGARNYSLKPNSNLMIG
jgi:hypothetical protein